MLDVYANGEDKPPDGAGQARMEEAGVKGWFRIQEQ